MTNEELLTQLTDNARELIKILDTAKQYGDPIDDKVNQIALHTRACATASTELQRRFNYNEKARS